MAGEMSRFRRADVSHYIRHQGSGRGLLCGLAVIAGLASGWPAPARAANCNGMAAPDLEQIGRLRESGRYDALERILGAYQRAYQRDPTCEPYLWDAFGDSSDWSESDRGGFDRWVAARPDSWMARSARGVFWTWIGFKRRGEDSWADTPQSRRTGMLDAMSRASVDLRRGIALNPRDVVAYGTLLQVLKADGGTAQALSVYRAALAADPLSKAVRVRMLWAAEPNWGGSLALMKQICADADAHAKENPRLREVRAFLYEWEGQEAWRAKRYPEAIRAYRKALHYLPDNENWEILVARFLHVTHHDPAALEELGALLARHPQNVDALVLRSDLLLKRHRRRDALADADRAIRADPANPKGWEQRAFIDQSTGHWRRAEQEYAKVAALAKGTETRVDALQQEGQLLAYHLGRAAEGEAAFQRAIALDPKNALTWVGLAELRLDHHRPGVHDALRHFVALADPSNPEHARRLKLVRAWLKSHPDPESPASAPAAPATAPADGGAPPR